MEKVAPEPTEIEKALLDAVAASHGHFVYESGHHGDLWLDLDGLFVDARRARSWAAASGEAAAQIAGQYGAPLFLLASLECERWSPEGCPLCKSGVALQVAPGATDK